MTLKAKNQGLALGGKKFRETTWSASDLGHRLKDKKYSFQILGLA